MSEGRRRAVFAVAAAALLALLAVRLGTAAWADSLTYDETRYIRTGVCGVVTRTADLEVSNPPLHKLLAGVAVVALGQRPDTSCASDQAFYPRDPGALRRLVLAARVPAVVLTLVLAVLVLLWARSLYGDAAGLLALAVVAAEPTIAAHGHLATGDLPVTTAMVAALAAHHRWVRTGARRWLVTAGVALGLALLAKTDALVVVPVVMVAAAACARGGVKGRVQAALRDGVVVAAVAWVVVCAVYLPLTQTHHAWGAPLSWVAPPSWFDTVRNTMNDRSTGHLGYLNGVIRPGDQPFPAYFVEALTLKTTPWTLALAGLASVATALRRDRDALLWLWVPAALLVAVTTLQAVDVGVRYVLPVYPLVAVAAGAVVARGLPLLPGRQTVAGLCAAGAVAVGATTWTEQVGYVNMFGGERPQAYLSDSNLDWGQDLWRLRDWWVAHGRPHLSYALFTTLPPAFYGLSGGDVSPGRKPVTGLLAASLTRITVTGDITTAPYVAQPYTVLQRRAALARVGTSVEVFDMGPSPGTTAR